eukprot:COSAG06_NODE_9256_length_1945_cov_2.793608_2_plen_69_part_01
MMPLLFAGALLLAAASAERTTTWRIAVAGPGCEALFAADDFVPVNATHGDLFVAHDLKNRTDARLAEQH